MFERAQQQHLKDHGFCVIPNVLSTDAARDARRKLVQAAAESERRGFPTYLKELDPNDRNVRVFNLLDLDPVFIELIAHPAALAAVRHLLSDDFIISNFTANIAKPGSGSMKVHSDLAVVHPEPWLEPWSINTTWCLDCVREENGATRYLPNSHRISSLQELPEDLSDQLVPFEAPVGSLIVMDGRLWHTSGANQTKDEERALLFGYYTRSFLRPQWNFNVGLAESTKAQLSTELRQWLGLGLQANMYQFLKLGQTPENL